MKFASCLAAAMVLAVASAFSDPSTRFKNVGRVGDPPPICVAEAEGKGGDHIFVTQCDKGDPSQHLRFIAKYGEIQAKNDLCLTVGTDVDPASGTPSIDLQPCNGKPTQVFSHNATTFQLINPQSGRCLDLDSSDSRVETYGCNSPVSPNQQWFFNVTNEVRSKARANGCMAPCKGIEPGIIGTVTQVTAHANRVDVVLNTSAQIMFIEFYHDSVFRLFFSPLGNEENPARDEIVINKVFDNVTKVSVSVKKETQGYRIETKTLELILSFDALLTVKNKTSGDVILQESARLQWNVSSIWQTLERQSEAQFYGGGMQNGYFSHRDQDILIQEGGGYTRGGRANPAPWYMSTSGYGVLRNTYSSGMYSFRSPSILTHNEPIVDAFYFCGSLKRALDLYTQATGRPFLPPLWGLTLGDSNCYNSKNRTTPDVIPVAQGYLDNKIPGGWMIMNDGYGCGYVDLPAVIEQLHARGKYSALWTSTGLDNATWEIGVAGSRGIKTDVAWVGAGYKFGLDAVKLATGLIENNTNSRRYIWTVCGWAGTHHYGIMWNGDNSGGYDYLEFQIPTVLGSGLSAQAYTSGDVDGIFGGSAETYVRDLQWKVFLPVLMSMSGWAQFDKQPWRHGEPYTSYNRKYLELKMQLLPYQYSYAYQSHTTGLPMARALVLEYEEDPNTWGPDTTGHEFLSGEAFLVAPVFENTSSVSSIYFPGHDTVRWTDYWTGEQYKGGSTINDFYAPLDILPLFVKSGSIIPMWPSMLYVGEKPVDTITFDLYPDLETDTTTTFDLYEDDGVSRNFERGEFTLTRLELVTSKGESSFVLHPAQGFYDGMMLQRTVMLSMHVPFLANVTVDKAPVAQCSSWEELNAAATGFFFDPTDRGGVAHVKCGTRQAYDAMEVRGTVHV